MQSIGILTSGGDAPGLNAVIRAAVRSAFTHGGDAVQITGYIDGFAGVILGKSLPLTTQSVAGIIRRGGTILGSGGRCNPFDWEGRNYADQVAETLGRHDATIIIGGNGSMGIACDLNDLELPVVGVPKTIDNDIYGTDITFGFDSAVSYATEAIDRLHPTADAHHRVMVVEVMGRDTGHIALHAGVAGGADVICIPEIPFAIPNIVEAVHRREADGKRQTIVVVAEGARAEGSEAIQTMVGKRVRYGGIAQWLAEQLGELVDLDIRVVQLGYLQRGGEPTARDRALATMFGSHAITLIATGTYGQMVALRQGQLTSVQVSVAARAARAVDPADPMILSARSVGIALGDGKGVDQIV